MTKTVSQKSARQRLAKVAVAALCALSLAAACGQSGDNEDLKKQVEANRQELEAAQKEIAELKAKVTVLLNVRNIIDPANHPASPAAGTSRPYDRLDSPGDPVLDGIFTKTGGYKYDVDRKKLEAVLAEPLKLARGARIVPSIKNGKPNGFKLYAVRPNSIYKRAGIQNGDTLVSVNGHDLSSPDKALEAYSKVRSSSSVVVEILRRGRPLTLRYRIR